MTPGKLFSHCPFSPFPLLYCVNYMTFCILTSFTEATLFFPFRGSIGYNIGYHALTEPRDTDKRHIWMRKVAGCSMEKKSKHILLLLVILLSLRGILSRSSCTPFDPFPPLLRPATQAIFYLYPQSCIVKVLHSHQGRTRWQSRRKIAKLQ